MNMPPVEQIFVKKDKASGEFLHYRRCTKCKNPDVLNTDRFKTCSRCREKNRMKKAPYTTSAENYISALSSHPLVNPTKRKAEKTLNELEGEEHKRALKMVKRSVNAAVQTSKKSHKEPPRAGSLWTEYQKASMLYDAAKLASSALKLCNFSGCHSIVRCQDIDNEQRARMVVNDLRKLVRLPFSRAYPAIKRVKEETVVEMAYSCTCKSSASAPKSLSTHANPSGRTAGGDTDWPKASNAPIPSKENVNTTEVSCGGSITVRVQDDHSHFLRIPGQQIIIHIAH